MSSNTSQQFESYVPVYDTIPEKWEDAREMLVEALKKISNEINVREIGFFLDEEQLTGKGFIPTSEMSGDNSSDSQQTRSIFRKVIDTGALVAGAKSVAHGITIDSNFSLIDLWVAATNSGTLVSQVITDGNVDLDATNINITSPGIFDRSWCIIEYIQEV